MEIQDLYANARERIEKSNEPAKHQANKHNKDAHVQPIDFIWIH